MGSGGKSAGSGSLMARAKPIRTLTKPPAARAGAG
jgi:hypothetical protein